MRFACPTSTVCYSRRLPHDIKPIDADLVAVAEGDYVTIPLEEDSPVESIPPERCDEYLKELEEKMREAARKFDFKQAASYRDKLQELRNKWITDSPA